jgi:hypothetical protein
VQLFDTPGDETGLFDQLPRGGLLGWFVGFQRPGGKFDQARLHRHAEVLDQAHAVVCKQRQNHDRAGVPHNRPQVRRAVNHLRDLLHPKNAGREQGFGLVIHERGSQGVRPAAAFRPPQGQPFVKIERTTA